ncbi:MAG: SufD family Fe-S cluster assembly protein [Candidatus Krumholzibacteriia bacterium]
MVEIVALPGASVCFATIQNWPRNVINLVSAGTVAHARARVEWLDCNIGSGLTLKNPCVRLAGEGAAGRVHTVTFAGRGQTLDAGVSVVHAASGTESSMVTRTLVRSGGCARTGGRVEVEPHARGCRARVRGAALLLDAESNVENEPQLEIGAPDARVEHETRRGGPDVEQIFYLMSRGIPEAEARLALVNGFIEPFARQLPMEYAVELQRMAQLEMGGPEDAR